MPRRKAVFFAFLPLEFCCVVHSCVQLGDVLEIDRSFGNLLVKFVRGKCFLFLCFFLTWVAPMLFPSLI